MSQRNEVEWLSDQTVGRFNKFTPYLALEEQESKNGRNNIQKLMESPSPLAATIAADAGQHQVIPARTRRAY